MHVRSGVVEPHPSRQAALARIVPRWSRIARLYHLAEQELMSSRCQLGPPSVAATPVGAAAEPDGGHTNRAVAPAAMGSRL